MPERLTDRAVAAFRHPGGSELGGPVRTLNASAFSVRVYASGVKSFTFDWSEHGRVRRRHHRPRAPAWTIGAARLHATKLRMKADVGESVAAQRGTRVEDLAEQWRGVVDLTRRPSTAKSYGRLLDSHVIPAFGKGEPKAITRNAVELWHAKIAQTTPTEANRALAILSAFLSWCGT